MEGIFDSHAHYDDPRFDADRAVVLEGLPQRGVSLVMNVGADLESSAASTRLAGEYSFVYAAVGIHPQSAQEATPAALDALEVLCRQPKVRAIGEIGLDYHYLPADKALQQKAFEQQLALAGALHMPVIIHSRDAHQPTLDTLRRFCPRGVVHCFSGSAELARQLVALGLYIGFTGVVTFHNARRALEAAAAVPPDRLLIETDCPYMAPAPFRGQRCDSGMLPQVVQALAAVRGVPPQKLADQTRQNACALYGIMP